MKHLSWNTSTTLRIVVLSYLCFVLIGWTSAPPKIFLIGDSISIHYTPYLREYLADWALFSRKEDDGSAEKNLDIPSGANGGDSHMVLEYLKARLKSPDMDADYLLLNCGLHDIKRDVRTQETQVSEEQYRENLEAIESLVRSAGIRLVWIRSTPVVDSIHNARSKTFKRYAKDLEAYNQIADDVFRKAHVPIIDLFQFTQRLGEEQISDHVHYHDNARALQAAYIAGFLQRYVQGNEK